MAYATYLRLKISSVLDGFASSVCAICRYPEDSNHAALVRNAVHAWARTAGLYAGLERGGSDRRPCRRRELPGAAADGRSDRRADRVPESVRSRLHTPPASLRDRGLQLVVPLRWQGRLPREGRARPGKKILYDNIAALDALAHLQLPAEEPAESRQRAEQLRQLVRAAFPEDGLGQFIDANGPDGTSVRPRQRRRLRHPLRAGAGIPGRALAAIRAFASRTTRPRHSRLDTEPSPRPRRSLPRIPDLGRPPLPDPGGRTIGEGDRSRSSASARTRQRSSPPRTNGKVEGTRSTTSTRSSAAKRARTTTCGEDSTPPNNSSVCSSRPPATTRRSAKRGNPSSKPSSTKTAPLSQTSPRQSQPLANRYAASSAGRWSVSLSPSDGDAAHPP